MAEIDIILLKPQVYQVTVTAAQTTQHEVSIDTDASLQLTAGKLDDISLVRASFVFLLAHEPNTSILRQFNLRVICQYFPDYPQAMRAYSEP